MDQGQLNEMFNYVKGKSITRKGTSESLGKVVGQYMDGDIPTLVLDTERELDANSVSAGNFVVVESAGGGGQKPGGQQPNHRQQRQSDDDDDDVVTDETQIGSEESVTRGAKVTAMVNLGQSTPDGIPIMQPDPEFIEHASEKQLKNIQGPVQQNANRTNNHQPQQSQPIHTPINNQSPTIVLLSKAKTKKLTVDLKLEIEAYDESLISVLVENYGSEAKEEIINFIVSKIDNKTLKDAMAAQLKAAYKSLESE